MGSSEYMKFKQLDAAFLQDIYFVNTPHTIWALPVKNETKYMKSHKKITQMKKVIWNTSQYEGSWVHEWNNLFFLSMKVLYEIFRYIVSVYAETIKDKFNSQ